MTILYSDVEPLSKYSPVTLHLSPATRILNENPVVAVNFLFQLILSFHCFWVWLCMLMNLKQRKNKN